MKRDLAGLQDRIAQCNTFRNRIECVLHASADWCEQHPQHLMAYLRHRLLSVGAASDQDTRPDSSDIALAWQQLIAAGQQSGELSSASPAEQLATWFHHLYLGALLRWLNTPGLSLEGEFRSITTLFIEGAAAKE